MVVDIQLSIFHPLGHSQRLMWWHILTPLWWHICGDTVVVTPLWWQSGVRKDETFKYQLNTHRYLRKCYQQLLYLTSYNDHPMYLLVSRLSDQQVWPFSALRDQKTIFRYRLNKEVTNFKYNESLFFGIPPKKIVLRSLQTWPAVDRRPSWRSPSRSPGSRQSSLCRRHSAPVSWQNIYVSHNLIKKKIKIQERKRGKRITLKEKFKIQKSKLFQKRKMRPLAQSVVSTVCNTPRPSRWSWTTWEIIGQCWCWCWCWCWS